MTMTGPKASDVLSLGPPIALAAVPYVVLVVRESTTGMWRVEAVGGWAWGPKAANSRGGGRAGAAVV